MNNKESCRIAIIGLSCFYPGAKSPVELWENILARRQQFRQMPDVRLPNSEYYDSDPNASDKTYQKKAAVTDGYSFDWLEKRIPKKSFESTDIVHWLALDMSLQAIADAGYAKGQLPSEKTGVIIGNTLTGEFTRSTYMRQRWPYIRKVLKKSLEQKGLMHHFDELEPTMQKYYKSVFTPMTEDSLAGGLANTIAGRVCNFLDLHGGGYIVDGACSSSLLAICTAANALESGQMDMAIAGGVDISLDTFELIGFAKTGALTKDEMRVYDKNGAGFLPGEGCGVVIMKRLEDAGRDGDQIYAILNGWGISSDGKGGITAPSSAGQSKALRRAYDKADFDTSKLDFIEGHGTGTPVGDKTELEGIALALNKEKVLSVRSCGVTSFKSIVGHTKAAAGVGAFIKTVISLNRRVLPPTAGLKDPNPIFADTAKSLYPILHGEIRKAEDVLYAGVSAMGFGGINSHVLLQSGNAPSPKFEPSIEEKKLLVSNQNSEVFFLSANNKDELIDEVDKVSLDAAGISYAELADFACLVNKNTDLQKPIRVSIVAINPFDLERKLNVLKFELENTTSIQANKSLEANSIFFGFKKDNLRIGALYPGQGSQKLNMGNKLVQRFEWASELVEHAEGIFAKENTYGVTESVFRQIDRVADKTEEDEWKNHLKQTDIAQPAIILNSLIWQIYLEQLGLKFACGTGHSLGELMSFYSAGFYDERTLLRFAAFRGKSMSLGSSDGKAQLGSMASLICSVEKAKELIKKAPGYATVANINSPEQTVISGESESIKYIIELAKQEQIIAMELPVSAAFHSELISDTAEAIKRFELLREHKEKKKDFALISSVSGNEIHDYTDLNAYFADQAIGQVNFVAAINIIKKKCDVLIEIGSGKVLSGLVNNITPDIKCYPVEALSEDDLSFNTMLASLFVLGADINVKELYKNRLIREFKPAREKEFIVNPVERPFPAELDELLPVSHETQDNLRSSNNSYINDQVNGDFNSKVNDEIANSLHLPFFDMQAYMKERGDFLREIVLTDLKYLRSSDKQITYSKNINDSDSQTKSIEAKNNGTQNNGNARHIVSQVLKLETKAIANELRMQENSIIKAEINTTPQKLISLENLDRDIASTKKGVSKDEIQTTLYALVAEKTGFPAEGLKPEYRLLDDLNMDSIKAGTLLGELAKQYGLQGKFETTTFANASIADIAENIASLIENNIVTTSDDNIVKDIADIHIPIETSSTTQVIAQTNQSKTEEEIALQSYSVELVEERISNEFSLSNLDKNVGIIFSKLSEDKAKNISKSLLEQMAPDIYSKRTKFPSIELIDISDISNKNLKSLGKLLILMPNTPQALYKGEKEELDFSLLQETVNLLSTIAINTAEFENDLVFIQSGDGYFSRNHILKNYNLNNYSAVSFAASMHFERPENKIRVIEFHDKLNIDEITKLIFSEIEDASDKYIAAAYDENSVRRKMIYGSAEEKKEIRNNLQLTSSDVILVTGGGKGITAECALALASKYNCKMALIGSSPLSDEVRDTLSKYSLNNLSAQYYSCDITKLHEVYELISQIKSELGNVTGIIHGAAVNKPRLSGAVKGEEAYKEISPKLIGALNLIEALTNTLGNEDPETSSELRKEGGKPESTNSLKLFVALTSIIGITGMPGNSWYAFSNEALDLILRNLNQAHNVETLSMAYSVWGETGMGAKMGSIKKLAEMGIGAISTKEGVTEFIKWIENKSNDQQIVVAAGLGGLDTWKEKPNSKIKANRYLEEIIHLESGHEIVARALLSTEHDKYISDHDFNGSLLFPTVFGLEAMTQAAAHLCGLQSLKSVTFENVSLLRPVVIPKNGEIKIQIRAQIMPSYNGTSHLTRLKASISTEDSNFTIEHFSADIILNPNLEVETYEIDIPSEPLRLHPETDLYSWLLFQGKMFQNMDKIYTLDENRVIMSIKVPFKEVFETCFSLDKKTSFSLGNPLTRDILLQAGQLILSQKSYLPFKIEKWEIFKRYDCQVDLEKSELFIVCNLLELNEKQAIGEVYLVDRNGQIFEKLSNYISKAIKASVNSPSPSEIADTDKLENKVNFLLNEIKDFTEHPFDIVFSKQHESFSSLSKRERQILENKIFAEQYLPINKFDLTEPENTIAWQNSGKPYITNSSDLGFSISHTKSFLLMVIGKENQGCDIEFVEERSKEDWYQLLGTKLSSNINELTDIGIKLNLAGTYLWSIKESIFKASGEFPEELSVLEVKDNKIIFSGRTYTQDFQIAAVSIEIWPKNILALAIVLFMEKRNEKTLLNTQNDELSEDVVNYEMKLTRQIGTRTGVYGFITTFKDCKSFFGKVYFSEYAVWMGKIREMSLKPIGKKLLEDLNGGSYAMVTNASSLKIYNEAESLENIICKIRATNLTKIEDSFIDLVFEWFKKDKNGNLIKLADSNLSSTWVRVEAYGIVKREPLPDYFIDFLQNLLIDTPNIMDSGDIVFLLSNLSTCIYRTSNSLNNNSLLLIQEELRTGIIDSNSVGNLYYSNYYDWQAKSIEKFIYSLKPEIFTSQGRKGEYICLESNVNHLQEAMPFETIEVCMYLEELYEKGFKLYFEYFSVNENTRRKLAYGSNTILWAKRKDENSPPVAEELHSELKSYFMDQIPNNPKLLESIS